MAWKGEECWKGAVELLEGEVTYRCYDFDWQWCPEDLMPCFPCRVSGGLVHSYSLVSVCWGWSLWAYSVTTPASSGFLWYSLVCISNNCLHAVLSGSASLTVKSGIQQSFSHWVWKPFDTSFALLLLFHLPILISSLFFIPFLFFLSHSLKMPYIIAVFTCVTMILAEMCVHLCVFNELPLCCLHASGDCNPSQKKPRERNAILFSLATFIFVVIKLIFIQYQPEESPVQQIRFP